MTLIVTDAAGRRYKPTGQFREPKPGEAFWSVFDRCVYHYEDQPYRRVPDAESPHPWHGHFIILELLPVEYEVTVRLARADIEQLEQMRDTDALLPRLGARVGSEVMEGRYREVPQGETR